LIERKNEGRSVSGVVCPITRPSRNVTVRVLGNPQGEVGHHWAG
jgi:hypothetical protein